MALFSRKSARPAPISLAAAAPRPAVDDPRVFAIGSELLAAARSHKAGLLSSKFYSDALMNWSMKDPNFKVQLFRFVDCFPMLRTPEDVYDHLNDYLSQPGVTVPGVIDAALKAGSLAKGLAAGQISKQITGMAQKFIAGTDAASALPNLKELWEGSGGGEGGGIAFSVDLLGEACVSDEEADAYQAKYLDLINNLPAAVSSWKPNPRLESDHLGPIPRVNVSIKISSLSARCDPIDTEGSIRDLMRRLVPILEAAKARGVFVNFDMEQFALKDLTIELFQRCVEKMGDGFHAGLAMQAYLMSGDDDARRMVEWARRTGKTVTVRLVKGAYWDYHVIHSEQMGWPCPVWPTKRQTDACFERMTDIFLDACPGSAGGTGVSPVGSSGGIRLALGSHNLRSIAYALAGLEKRNLPTNAIELQMLHGMADQLKLAASEWGGEGKGLRVREYIPVGEMIPGMAYLVRRLLENTSNESWLRAGFLDNADPAALLASPHSQAPHTGNGSVRTQDPGLRTPDPSRGIALEGGGRYTGIDPARHNLSPTIPGLGDGKPFFNEPFRDFSQKPQRDAFAAAVARAAVPAVANDTTPQQAAEMVRRAHDAFPAWRDADPMLRAQVLIRAAAAMRSKRDELAGIMIKESGKTWREADADVCEAIDFCEYYARCAVPLFQRERMGRFIGELDEQWHQPRGVAVIISPWNFPLAICTGMTAAALVTGNTVIVKPAEQTPGIAKVMADILHRALSETLDALPSVPPCLRASVPSVLHFCPAPGETTGAALVRDPRIALIAFTGSRDVGLDILNAAAPPSPFKSQISNLKLSSPSPSPSAPSASLREAPSSHVKRVVCEMGGKNALIIDTSADLDEAVLAARHSAFGFQGQKCSACSRLIVVDPAGPDGPAIRTIIHRLVEATKALVIGDPALPGTDIGPVIDADAAAKITGYITRAKSSGLKHACVPIPASLSSSSALSESSAFKSSDGRALHFVSPHIFWPVPPDHELARDEIFGPVLAIMHAATFDDALNLANSSPYKLTGGVFTRKPSHIDKAKREFRVGNLYINRGITGALVARQPFGGFGMSGVGSKAGGKDYLLQFIEPRASCENTMRRGFAPEL